MGFVDGILKSICAKNGLIVTKKVIEPTKNKTVDRYRKDFENNKLKWVINRFMFTATKIFSNTINISKRRSPK